MKKHVQATLGALALAISTNVFAADPNIVHQFDKQNPLGNIGVSESGRLFMSNHHFYGADNKIVEIKNNGNVVAHSAKV